MNITNFILTNPILKDAPEIIFYGGSFNPWHQGHSSCVHMSPSDIPLIVIPDHNPQKAISNSKGSEQLILELMNKVSFRDETAFIYDSFYKLLKSNPTHIWINDLKEQFPDKKLSLLMGHDSFLTIHNWIRSHELLNNLTNIYIVSRLDVEQEKEDQKQVLYQIAKNLNIIFLGHHEFEELSSTKLRKSLT